MLKLKIDNVEYMLMPIPPALSPYSTLISDLLKKKPANCEDADRTSKEIEKAMEKLLAGTVKPETRKEHHIQLFNALINLTNKTLEDAGLFRGSKGSKAEKSGSAGAFASQEAE